MCVTELEGHFTAQSALRPFTFAPTFRMQAEIFPGLTVDVAPGLYDSQLQTLPGVGHDNGCCDFILPASLPSLPLPH